MFHLARIVLFTAFLSPSLVQAGIIDVPGDYPDPQAAINNASPGDVILIHGGTWGPLVIDRSLQLIGDPAPLIVGLSQGIGLAPSPIKLAGPGAGTVVLQNLNVGGTINGSLFSAGSAAISGEGFDSLLIYDSTVSGPAWFWITGVAAGIDGIKVNVPLVVVERSNVSASDSDPGCYYFCQGMPSGGTGIDAGNGTLVVLDSLIAGGGSLDLWDVIPCAYQSCSTGVGGTGAIAGVLYRSGSTIVGGQGLARYDITNGAFCCRAPDGRTVQAGTTNSIDNYLQLAGDFQIGGTFTLNLSFPNVGMAILFASLGWPSVPYSIPGVGLVFLDASQLLNLGPVGGQSAVPLPVPLVPFLVGIPISFQAYDLSAGGGLSRPVDGVISP